jgi:hypothetical protein
MTAIFLWTCQQLRQLLRAVKRGHPFDPLNPKRIRRIAWVVIAIGPVRDARQFIAAVSAIQSGAIRQALPGASVGYALRFSWETVVIGLVMLAIAYAFEAGVRLQNDQDLTI